jgi:geranylgeranyl diphosphate synthase type I
MTSFTQEAGPTACQTPAYVPGVTEDTAEADLLESLVAGLDSADLLDEICRHALVPPGKLFRPWLLLESCAAAGGDPWRAVPAALGTEFGHVASLIHDDIIDQDEVRRGRSSVQHQYGQDNAIVAGDAMLFGLYLRLAQCHERGVEPRWIVAALEAVSRAGIELCRGQINEAFLCANAEARLDQYVSVIRGKTAALFSGACEVGGLLAGGDEGVVALLRSYGDELGITFQMADDLLAYCSTDDCAGKDLLSDSRNRRMTFPLIMAAEAGGAAVRKRIAAMFSADSRTSAVDLHAESVQIIESTRALEQCRDLILEHAQQALLALQQLPDGPPRTRLADKVLAAAVRAA